jgi:hypothetical protein
MKEEAVRLFYVALTRAETKLHLYWDNYDQSYFYEVIIGKDSQSGGGTEEEGWGSEEEYLSSLDETLASCSDCEVSACGVEEDDLLLDEEDLPEDTGDGGVIGEIVFARVESVDREDRPASRLSSILDTMRRGG